jgi:hypothetical protein
MASLVPSVRSLVIASKAARRAAEHLGLRQAEFAAIVGMSPTTASRLYNGQYELKAESKELELSLLLVRVFRSLDAILGGDLENMKKWIDAENRHLSGVPRELLKRAEGLVRVAEYLDAMRGAL